MKHKLIMENWRRFINERKSDEEYIQAARFLSNTFSDESLVDVIVHDPSEENSWMNWAEEYGGAFSHYGVEHDADPKNKKHKAFKIKIKDESYETLWQQYQQITEKSAIFSNFDEFKYWLSKLEVYLLFHRENTGGDMSPDGIMRIFLRDKVDLISSSQEALNIIKQKAYEVFIHEGAHYFNAIRAKGSAYRSAGGEKQFDPQSQEYKDSTEELQARMIEIQDEFMNRDWQSDGDKMTFYDYLYDAPGGNDGIRRFINEFINLYYPFASEISEKHRKRVISRVYQFVQRILNSEDYEEFVDFMKFRNQKAQEQGTVALQERKRHVKKG